MFNKDEIKAMLHDGEDMDVILSRLTDTFNEAKSEYEAEVAAESAHKATEERMNEICQTIADNIHEGMLLLGIKTDELDDEIDYAKIVRDEFDKIAEMAKHYNELLARIENLRDVVNDKQDRLMSKAKTTSDKAVVNDFLRYFGLK